ncbi:hypothetical protein [Duganella radicis]|uniref:DUF1640 domain-containing protein n=1 Tax=Duganella radicis TaxID=551988 RepID=A0A6L6PDV7_9BURK|nr:hypothetical protein [Duganella radicis]MTV37093.1 hypothetical protein [Duganella radicis]
MNSVESTKYRKTLEEGGVPSGQAQAHADALGEVLENIASKEWVKTELEHQLGDLKFDMLKWMISLFVAQTGITVGAVIALVRYLPH